MPASDLDALRAFFELYPFDDLHRYHRPVAVLGATFGGKFESILAFLAPSPNDPELSDADRDVSKALGF
ncbi:hypothetical protein A9K69_01485 [Stenotrophomonas maltophilia]|nr:hypothetical protein A9K69_01485 [Stenotrophomonas maltophilia]